MIASVRGKVLEVGLNSVVIEVGGVGLDLRCTPDTLSTLRTGHEVAMPTSLVVREDSLTLFGFVDSDEKDLFELLQTASGVGAKTALTMLACLSPDILRTAIASEDVKTLTRVPGIGQKGAQRIILELKDRIGAAASTVPAASRSAAWEQQVHTGLVGLGWSVKEADGAVAAVRDEATEPADVGALLRAALRTLGKR
ncbi:MAG TPA: Holliday junction branch migration protein RuvA [Marmoricola sp.]|nr:Holliday junction branch migration protein RuvA [Marmoricola sp.]